MTKTAWSSLVRQPDPTVAGRVLPPQRAINPVDGVKNNFWRYEYHLTDHLGNLRPGRRYGGLPVWGESQREFSLGYCRIKDNRDTG